MAELKVDNYIIDTPIIEIIKKLKSDLTNGKLKTIEDKGEYVRVTCPFHKDGLENRASCSVYAGDGDIEVGTVHCFTCGKTGKMWDFVAECLEVSPSQGKRWLINNFGNIFSKPKYDLKSIVLSKVKPNYLDESILKTFDNYHPYMSKRKISDDVIKKFELGYDEKTNCIVFPVRNKYGKLSFLTRRSVHGKKFIIDTGIKKEVYLLYDVLKNNYQEVYICESQINSLVCHSYGKPAVATFGCGCPDYQIEDLNNTTVLHYIIAFDPDAAGLKGIIRLCDNLSKNKFISVMVLPDGKDVGDLTKEEFDQCKIVPAEEFLKNIPDYYAK